MSNRVLSLQEMLSELKKRKGLASDGYAGTASILEKVKAIESAAAEAAEQAHKAAVKGEDLGSLSILDPITELYNHHALVKELQAELKRAARYKQPIVLILVAIDNFDAIVREYGALTGQAILRVVAKAIRGGVPKSAISGRYNEQQFVIVLPRHSAATAAMIADEVRERIGNQAISYNWHNFSITASIGIACYPEHAQEYDQLIACAMEAMEHATTRGGDRVLSI